jgi:type VI protein secretion system component VasF
LHDQLQQQREQSEAGKLQHEQAVKKRKRTDVMIIAVYVVAAIVMTIWISLALLIVLMGS